MGVNAKAIKAKVKTNEKVSVVLVTDGAQSSTTPFNASATGEVACTGGADPSCIAALLRQRIDEGYGVWALRYFRDHLGGSVSDDVIRRVDGLRQSAQCDAQAGRGALTVAPFSATPGLAAFLSAQLNDDPRWSSVTP